MEDYDFCVYYLDYVIELDSSQLDLCSRFGMSCDGCCHCLKGAVPLD